MVTKDQLEDLKKKLSKKLPWWQPFVSRERFEATRHIARLLVMELEDERSGVWKDVE